MENTDGWAIDSDLSFAPLRRLNWVPEWVPWRNATTDWNSYDAVYLAAAWDYPQYPDEFLHTLAEIDRSRAMLVNDLSLVQWNMSKSYLRDLESAGNLIVPSLWFEGFSYPELVTAFDVLDSDRIVIKPAVSTNATDTFLLDRERCIVKRQTLQETFHEREHCVQPFMHSIQSKGEYSLFYFDRVFSHAILKTPTSGDYRVQEEHGASLSAIAPPGDALRTADRALGGLEPCPVYARVDLVRGARGNLHIMELELIEPSLYFRLDDNAADRFALAFDRYVDDGNGQEPK
jgi:hypothetical protein